MLEKNKIYRAEVIDVNNFGDGICRLDGLVVFVKGGVTGDELDIKIIKLTKSYAVAIIDKIIKASPYRCENDCTAYKRCGGCVTRHIAYAHELELKRGYVVGAMKRAGLGNVTVHETATAGVTEGYRNKAQYPVGLDKKTGRVKIGFYAGHTHEIADASECKLAPTEFTRIVADIREFIESRNVSVYDESTGKGLVRHIYLRRGETTGSIMLCLVVNGRDFALSNEFVSFITERNPEVTGILLNLNTQNTNVILSDDYKLLWGRDYINDTLCEREFRVSKSSFYQVNRRAAELLYKKAGELAALKRGDVLVDLYSGVGTVGMSIAERDTTLYGIEIVPEAIENAKINAERNGFTDAHFKASDAAHFNEFIKDRRDGDLVVVVDPPRKGLAPSVIHDIAGNNPDRVVYISCNPDTLARDIVEFGKCGYVTNEVYPYDLFPRTGHCEAVTCLERRTVHNMKLNPSPFEMIKNGKKNIELRLFDEKRRKIRAGDEIVFTSTLTGEEIKARVIKLHLFDSFEELYSSLPLLKCGYTEENIDTAKPSDMEEYYSADEQKKYGVVGIELCLTDKED